MGRVIVKSLSNLTVDKVKILELGSGISASEFMPGCKLFEPSNDGGWDYRGLVVHQSPSGNQVTTVERDVTPTSRAIILHRINVRHYNEHTGRINHGSRCEAYFESLGDEGFEIIDTKLRELGQ